MTIPTPKFIWGEPQDDLPNPGIHSGVKHRMTVPTPKFIWGEAQDDHPNPGIHSGGVPT